MRVDPDPATERIVTTPVRQTSSTRVVDVLDAFTPVVASVYDVTATIAGPPDDASAPVVALWDSEILDTDTLHDNAVNSNRITIPTGKPGQYKISVRIVWNSNGARSEERRGGKER